MESPASQRCPWPGIEDPIYAQYHDTEWGVPLTDSRALFEKIVLESFQSGLSWLTILRKRENFRQAFDGFEPERVARFEQRDITRLMDNAGIVRNRAKIEAAIENAKAYLEIAKTQSFASFVWSIVETYPLQNARAHVSDAPAQTEASKVLSRKLKAAGFRFIGPTTAYAFMQSSGFVNDHTKSCHRYEACRKLQMTMRVPKP